MGARILTRDDAKSLIRSNTDKLKLPSDFTVIGEGALAGFSQVKELTIPEGVTRICSHAFFMRSFKNASGLERLILPASLTQFDLWAFYDCNQLKTVFLPENFPEQKALELFFNQPGATLSFGKKLLFSSKTKTVQEIMDQTSGILTPNTAAVLPVHDGVWEIPATYFAIASHAGRSIVGKKIRKIILPASIRLISPMAFSDLTTLEEIVIADGVEHIDNAAFMRCKNLRRVIIPPSVKRIGAGAFMECPQLQEIVLPPQLQAIEDELFSGCAALPAVQIPETVTKIGAGAFAGCASIHTLVLPDSVKSIGISAFWECSALQQLYISPYTKTIQQSALGNCPMLTELYMPQIVADALEQKRVLGENTNPQIQWIDQGSPKPAFTMMDPTEAYAPCQDPNTDQEVAEDLPQAVDAAEMAPVPMQQEAAPPLQEDAPVQPLDADAVRKLEQTIASMQEKIDALSAQNTAAAQNTQQSAIDTVAVEALNANLAAIQAKFDQFSDMQHSVEAIASIQEQVATIASMQSRVEQIAQMQETVHERVGAISDIQEKMSEIDDIRAKVDAIQPDAIGDMQQKVSEIADIRQKVDAISDIQEKVNEISNIREKVDAISGVQEKIDEISDIRQKVDAISEVQEKVSAISEIQQKVDAISEVQEKVSAISDIQQKVGAITDVQEKVGEISSTQADMNKRFAEITGKSFSQKDAAASVAPDALDSAFVPVQRGNYRKDDHVFTYEISKPVEGPKQRSLMLKDYSVIAFRSFREKEGGERFEIPEGVRRVETQAFWDCPRLLALELPHSLTEVEPDAFSGCSRLTDVYLCEEFPERRAAEYFLFRPETKLHWPKKGFLSKAKVLTVAELLEQYDDILTAEKAKKLQVRHHVLQIPEGYTILAPDMARGINPRSDEPEHTLQTIILPKTLRRIGARAFAGLETVHQIVMSKGLQIIDMNAFTGCTGPYRIIFPNSVSYIGPYAFAAPCRYEQIRLPNRLLRISENTFTNCDSLVSLCIPESVTEIGDCALSGCTSLSSLTIPQRFSEELKRILDGPVKLSVVWTEDAKDAYRQEPNPALINVLEPQMHSIATHRVFTKEMSQNCHSFAERLTLLRSHPYAGAESLEEMSNQTKFEIPLGVLRLCSYAFGQNSRLLTLIIPKALSVFEYAAFYGFERLRDVFLPEDFDRDSAAVLFMNSPQVLLNIGGSRPIKVRQVLNDCPWVLTSNDIAELSVVNGTMTIPNGYLVIASFVYHGIMGMTHLRTLQIPPSARLIGYHAFTDQEHLEEVICAEGLLAVEPHAFVDCHNLRRIVLPSTLRFLGSHPFIGCMQLQSLVLPKSFSNREEELRRDCPQLQIQWCEDFDEDSLPSQILDYSDLLEGAAQGDVEMLTPFDVDDLPQYAAQDAIDGPIETSVLSEETMAEAENLENKTQAMLGTHAAIATTADTETVAAETIDTDHMDALADAIFGTTDTIEAEEVSDEVEEKAAPTEETAIEAAEEAAMESAEDSTEESTEDTVAAVDTDHMDALADMLFGSEDITETETVSEETEEVDAPAVETAIEAAMESAEDSTEESTEDIVVAVDTDHMDALADMIFGSEDITETETVSEETEEEAAPAEETAIEAAEEAAMESTEDSTEESTEDTVAAVDTDHMDALADMIFGSEDTTETETISEKTEEEAAPVEETKPEGESLVDMDRSIPEDGRFTAKECRRWYHQESDFTIPNGYREIRAGACAALDELSALTIAESVERIGNGAFADCTALKTVVIPLSVTDLAEDAFDGCDAINSVTAPKHLADQILAMFGDTPSYVWLEDPPKIIGDGRFTAKIRNSMYHGEEILVIPEGYLEIRAGACAGLEEITELQLPATLEKIAGGAFADCVALKSLRIPASVTELAEDAFEGCTSLQSVTAPRHLEEIVRQCFPDISLQFTDNE